MPDGTDMRPAEAQPPGAWNRRRLTADEPSPASVFLDVPNMPWEETKFPGIRMKMLFSDPEKGMSTMLLKMEPGATVPLHEHTAIEQTYVLEGRFLDEEGECGPGQYVWRPAGNPPNPPAGGGGRWREAGRRRAASPTVMRGLDPRIPCARGRWPGRARP